MFDETCFIFFAHLKQRTNRRTDLQSACHCVGRLLPLSVLPIAAATPSARCSFRRKQPHRKRQVMDRSIRTPMKRDMWSPVVVFASMCLETHWGQVRPLGISLGVKSETCFASLEALVHWIAQHKAREAARSLGPYDSPGEHVRRCAGCAGFGWPRGSPSPNASPS